MYDDFISTSAQLPPPRKRKLRDYDSDDDETKKQILLQGICRTKDINLPLKVEPNENDTDSNLLVKKSDTSLLTVNQDNSCNTSLLSTTDTKLLDEITPQVNKETVSKKHEKQTHQSVKNGKRKKLQTNQLKKKIMKNMRRGTKPVQNQRLRKTKQISNKLPVNRRSNVANNGMKIEKAANKDLCKKAGCGKIGLTCCVKASVT